MSLTSLTVLTTPKMVEDGWDDNPEYGWKAKGGYHVVENNVGSAVAILEAVAQKVSKL